MISSYCLMAGSQQRWHKKSSTFDNGNLMTLSLVLVPEKRKKEKTTSFEMWEIIWNPESLSFVW